MLTVLTLRTIFNLTYDSRKRRGEIVSELTAHLVQL